MFRTNNQIFRLDGKNSFFDFRESFAIDKIIIQARKYDQNAAKGNRIRSAIDFYLDINDAAYFAELCKSGRLVNKINTLVKMKKPGIAINKYAGKITSDGNCISRQFRVEGNEGKYFFKVLTGPGKSTPTGAILPAYKDNEAEQIILKVTSEDIGKLGVALERAVRFYDTWIAMGVLEEKIESIKYHKDKENKVQNDTEDNDIPYDTEF